MEAKRLQKVEDLTLNMIEFDKEIKGLKDENRALRAKLGR
jgi:hypothetical protein